MRKSETTWFVRYLIFSFVILLLISIHQNQTIQKQQAVIRQLNETCKP